MGSLRLVRGPRNRGSALVEFVVLVPLLLLILVGLFDFGRAIPWAIRIEYAAHAGVMYAYQKYSADQTADDYFLTEEDKPDVVARVNAATGVSLDAVNVTANCECHRLDLDEDPPELDAAIVDCSTDECMEINCDGEKCDKGDPEVIVQVTVTDKFEPATGLLSDLIGDRLNLTVTKTQQLAR